MAELYYLRCRCGGERFLWYSILLEWCCANCSRRINVQDMIFKYAAVLGVAVEALEKISGTNPANSSAWPVMVIRDIQDTAEDALRSIRGEEKSL